MQEKKLNVNMESLRVLSQEQLISMVLEQNRKISELEERLRQVDELRRLANIRNYTPASEQVPYLFPEMEALIQYAEPEEKEEKPRTRTGKKKARRKCVQAPADTPVYTNDHTADAPEFLVRNGIRYDRIEDKVIDKMAYVPASVYVERNIYAQYRAECEGESNVILFSDRTTDALACSPSFAASVAVSKFDDHLPLYRQSEMLERSGIRLGRQTMAKWMVTWYSRLTGFERYLTKRMYSMNLVNMDETPLRVLDFRTENGRISNSSFMFIHQGSTFNEDDRKVGRLVVCSYIQDRKKKTLIDDYYRLGSSAFVMTDGLGSYNALPNHCTCWVHAVRKLKAVLKDRREVNAEKIVGLYDELYRIENRYRAQLMDGSMTASEFLRERKKESMPVIEEIFKQVDSLAGKYAQGEMLKGLSYIAERKDTLPRYLDIVEATPDNNASERVAKAFATGRKNWLFAQTVDGADASCFMYSIIESAKMNGLDPRDYLEYVFTYGPSASSDKEYDALLPWNVDLSKLSVLKEARKNARPDPERKEPYFFTGLSG